MRGLGGPVRWAILAVLCARPRAARWCGDGSCRKTVRRDGVMTYRGCGAVPARTNPFTEC